MCVSDHSTVAFLKSRGAAKHSMSDSIEHLTIAAASTIESNNTPQSSSANTGGMQL